VFFTDFGQPAAIPTAYVLPIPLAGLAFLAFRLMISGPKLVQSSKVLMLGGAFPGVSAWFDMLATIVHTPDLRLEQNPIARALLDSGHNCSFVVSYAVVCESLLMLAIGLLWGALFSHHSVVVAAAARARTVMQFLRVITGTSMLSRRRWSFPLTHRHLPDAYFVVWLLGPKDASPELHSAA
jgi:hypothetical protein